MSAQSLVPTPNNKQGLVVPSRALGVGIVLGFNVVDLEAEGGRVEREGGAVALAHVERDVLGLEGLGHHLLRCRHELGREAHLAVRAQHGERGDVAVHLGRVLLHLGEHVADDLALAVLSDIEQLRPRERVVKIVFHLVVFGEAREVAVLHLK